MALSVLMYSFSKETHETARRKYMETFKATSLQPLSAGNVMKMIDIPSSLKNKMHIFVVSFLPST